MKKKEPLYRKVRNNESFAHYNDRSYADYRHRRNTKKQIDDDGNVVLHKKESMNNTSPNGYCYKPLYRFLQSKVGQNWDLVYSEAKSRLDKEDPIWHIVYF